MQKAHPKPEHILTKRIGSTVYRVGIHFDRNVKESLDAKILRLLKNDLNTASSHDTMEPLQAGCLPERGSP